MVESFAQQKVFLKRARLTLGMIILKICLPDHKGLGFKIAGVGKLT